MFENKKDLVATAFSFLLFASAVSVSYTIQEASAQACEDGMTQVRNQCEGPTSTVTEFVPATNGICPNGDETPPSDDGTEPLCPVTVTTCDVGTLSGNVCVAPVGHKEADDNNDQD